MTPENFTGIKEEPIKTLYVNGQKKGVYMSENGELETYKLVKVSYGTIEELFTNEITV